MIPRLTVSGNLCVCCHQDICNCTSSAVNKIIESAMIRADLISEIRLGYYFAYHVFVLSDEALAVQQKKYFSKLYETS